MELPRKTIRFGPFELCPKSQEIWKHGVRIKLRRQPMAVLQILLEHSGEVVSREELQRRLWPSDTFVDFEHGLNTAVKELRGVLGDSATEPRYIETLPRVGYRMLVAGEVVSEEAKERAAEIEGVEKRKEATESRGAGWLTKGLAVAGLALILGGALYVGQQKWKKAIVPAAVPSGRVSLAVLRFENSAGDPDQDYFSDGLTGDLITQLGRTEPSKLAVIDGTGTKRNEPGETDLMQVGKSLGAQYVLTGSVERKGGRVRVRAKLLETRDGREIWSKAYEGGRVMSCCCNRKLRGKLKEWWRED